MREEGRLLVLLERKVSLEKFQAMDSLTSRQKMREQLVLYKGK